MASFPLYPTPTYSTVQKLQKQPQNYLNHILPQNWPSCQDQSQKIYEIFGNWQQRLVMHKHTCTSTDRPDALYILGYKCWIDDPGSLGDATACLDHLTLSTVLQALSGHNYLNYHHHIAGNFSEQNCRFCGEGCEEFIHLACECPALAMERLGSVRGLWLSRNPPDLYGLVRFTKVNRISKALERRAE